MAGGVSRQPENTPGYATVLRNYYFVADLSGDWSATGKIVTFINKLSSPGCDCVRFRVGVKYMHVYLMS